MNEIAFQTLAGLIPLTAIALSAHYRRKADRDSGEGVSVRQENRTVFLALRLGGLFIWLSPIVYAVHPGWLSWSAMGLPEAARWLGALAAVSMVVLLRWMFVSIGTGITSTVATRRKHVLVTSGPYRWMRHPLYTFGTVFFLGMATLIDSWFLAVLALAAAALLVHRTSSEEQHLIEKFGEDYQAYMRRTGRFLPRMGWRSERATERISK
jgi:protein-S-isoprenylcysteine O-methyltransferase Ste14